MHFNHDIEMIPIEVEHPEEVTCNKTVAYALNNTNNKGVRKQSSVELIQAFDPIVEINNPIPPNLKKPRSICKGCDNTFEKNEYLKIHVKTMDTNDIIQEKKFDWMNKLICHTNSDSPFTKRCKYQMASLEEVPSITEPIVCPQCRKNIKRKTKKEQHEHISHGGHIRKVTLKCTICPQCAGQIKRIYRVKKHRIHIHRHKCRLYKLQEIFQKAKQD